MRTTLVVILALLSAGCAVKTRETTHVNPDAVSSIEGTGIEARDIRVVARQMAGELLASPAVQKFSGVPRVAVMPVKNRSRFLIDQEIFTTLITDLVIQNAAGQLAILNRALVEEIMKERELKRSGQADASQLKALAGADFFLEGEVRSLSASTGEVQSDYVVIRFQMTDAENGIVVWSNTYEMKKEGAWGVMYQ